jgi:hypothetical protein
MKSSEFIEIELDSFVKNNPMACVKYGYDNTTKMHIVEVTPTSVYDNENYIDWETEVFSRFIKIYPNEDINFISDDAIVGIEKVKLTLYGEEYVTIPISINQNGKELEKYNVELRTSKQQQVVFSGLATTEINNEVDKSELYLSDKYKLAA